MGKRRKLCLIAVLILIVCAYLHAWIYRSANSQLVKIYNQVASKERYQSTISTSGDTFDAEVIASKIYYDNSTVNNQSIKIYPPGASVKGINQPTIATSEFIVDAEVIPRKVYYDNRTVANKPRDVLVILADISRYGFGKDVITHCELNGHKSKRVHLPSDPLLSWGSIHKPENTHLFGMVECYGFPHSAIFNGSIAYVIYKARKNKTLVRVKVEHPLLYLNMDNNATPMQGKNSIVVCTCMFNHPSRFNEWLVYQKTLGMDRVHLNVDKSFADNATIIYPFLEKALRSGFVVMEVWNKYIDMVHYYSQALKIQDCVMLYRGVFDHAFVLDYDDFITPLVPQQKDIHYYVKKIFHDNSIGCANILWINMPCELNLQAVSQLKDGNVTKTLKSSYGFRRSEGKSISKLSAIIAADTHSAFKFLPSYRLDHVYSKTLLYIAHIRTQKKKCVL